MKIASSLKSLKKRDLNSKLVRRRGRVYIINKKNPKFKARQKQFFVFMIIGSVSENKEVEKRISITPEIAKKYKDLGFEVLLSEDYGKHLGFNEKEYKELGVKFISDDKELIEKSDIIIQISLLENEKNSLLKAGQIFIGVLNPYDNKNKLDELLKKKINFFSLKSLKKRDLNSKLVRRRGRVYIINKKNPKFKARQK